MEQYKRINIFTGWGVFLIAASTYLLTIEPTTSFWDCGEFIATAYKLQVGHPPGAPLFMIVARVFSLFAFGDVTKVAAMVNSLSALASAFTILFLFWTITHLLKKIFLAKDTVSAGNTIAIMGAGVVGSLAYTFSDTFWFSAVEGEVYASSSLFTAVVFWAILKWENIAHEKYANRWLILIAYLIGLSIGVHLLNLLAIPAIVFVYYFKKYEVSRKGIVYAALISIALLGGIMYGIIPGIVKIAAKFELFFVNFLGMPYHSGSIFYIFLLLGLLVWGLYYTYQQKKVLANTIILGITVIVIGYSSYTMIVIRSYANPPIDENNPENVFSLLSYLNREQYGNRPLFYGQYYNAPVVGQENKYTYIQKNGKYEQSLLVNPVYQYDSRFMTLFPRMYSHQQNHVNAYKSWGGIKGKPIQTNNRYGKDETLYKPTFGENLWFFLSYQLNHMYIRYFMWNFVGRQNDIQGHGNYTNGNWLSGINFIDEMRLGPQRNLPDKFARNKSANTYYFLPLLLGILGLFFQYRHDKENFAVISLLFFFTGIAIVMYLNQTPYQPRERDYAYAGSFYAFAIWIGFGTAALCKYLNQYLKNKKTASIIAFAATFLLVPTLMAAKNWDDHDRSGRYTARDLAANYLQSCAPNAILFTYGDNDTFPLWYAQDVEGIRTDVRIVNMSLLGTDWYISQMKKRAYEADPLPFALTEDKYIQGKRDVVPILNKTEKRFDIKDIMKFVADDNLATKLAPGTVDEMDYIPARKLSLKVDSANAVKYAAVPKEKQNQMVKNIEWELNKNYLTKSDLMILDLLAEFNWERPIYFASSIGRDNLLGLENYLQLEGFAYRLVPYKTKSQNHEKGYIHSDLMYKNVMEKFNWGRMEQPDVYLDEQNLRTLKIMDVREVFLRLSKQLYEQGKKDSALSVLDKCVEVMPHQQIALDYFSTPMIDMYYKLEKYEKGDALVKTIMEYSLADLEYYLTISQKYSSLLEYEQNLTIYTLKELVRITGEYNRSELHEKIDNTLNKLIKKYGTTKQ
ncbi:MAG: hypothetical protein CSA05_00135 [Bacteroidia bacterium]|nr:MAG: hypothetical protein CSB01_01010 [Bacteroidia bacterium]PIE86533.1 MAG: hypothetical protein CSA05_00135 [Bacteroidia bacterium]